MTGASLPLLVPWVGAHQDRVYPTPLPDNRYDLIYLFVGVGSRVGVARDPLRSNYLGEPNP
jgi:hypothetical protein